MAEQLQALMAQFKIIDETANSALQPVRQLKTRVTGTATRKARRPRVQSRQDGVGQRMGMAAEPAGGRALKPNSMRATEEDDDMGKKVLVVDDANFMRTIVKDTLAPNGFEIVGEATNGAEAVTKYAELKPDLVTMDITMKVKDGLEAAREILAADPNARIVMVTALGQEKMLLDSIALGVRDFVVKPFTKERILSAVEKALH